ncbi:hypothetical protein [Psychromicrobium lacuslunae]|uniref:phosphotriesterase family protein n=1 Tax=Psychromicrobium lacuslunae TaxID=1618207 RepID=UPI0005D37928|nr:hypothetical protein [Psychromicrobium lacuslunae]
MSIVRSILGDLKSDTLGVTNSHDHLFFRSEKLPGQELLDSQLAEAEVRAFQAAGGQSIVQWTPAGLGRHRAELAAISRRTGVHLLSATGRHRREHYSIAEPPLSLEALTRRFIDDIHAEELPSGLIKIGVGFHHLDTFERTSLAAAAAAHAATGAPVVIHLELGSSGALVLDELLAAGVSPISIVLGHLGRNPDPYYLQDLARSGVWLGFEGPSRANHATDWRLLAIIEALAAEHHSQLLLGGDTTTAEARSVNSGPGMPALLTTTGQRIRRLLGETLWQAIFVDNPARAFSLRGPSADSKSNSTPGGRQFRPR